MCSLHVLRVVVKNTSFLRTSKILPKVDYIQYVVKAFICGALLIRLTTCKGITNSVPKTKPYNTIPP